jgi:CheY-like chemotaxis protein
MRGLAGSVTSRGIELFADVDPCVPSSLVGDPTRLRQVLTNLVGNAIKFTHKGQVIIRVRCGKPLPTGVALNFEVQDSGIGIPARKLAEIFNPFAQGDTSTTRKYGGTGLGLSISHRLVEAMGGTLQVASREGFGSNFSFGLVLGNDGARDIAPTNLLGNEIKRDEIGPTFIDIFGGERKSDIPAIESGKDRLELKNILTDPNQIKFIVYDTNPLSLHIMERELRGIGLRFEIVSDLNLLEESLNRSKGEISGVYSGSDAVFSSSSAEDENTDYQDRTVVFVDTHRDVNELVRVIELVSFDPSLARSNMSQTIAPRVLVSTPIDILATIPDEIQSRVVPVVSPVFGKGLLEASAQCWFFSRNEPSSINGESDSLAPYRRDSLCILVAEDNTVNQKLMLRLLERAGHQTVLVENGDDAIKLLEKRGNLGGASLEGPPIDLVFMDIQMPILGGVDATKIIREKEAGLNTHIPIVALTANAIAGQKDEYLREGMDDYLSKPIDTQKLKGVLDRYSLVKESAIDKISS